MRGQNGARNTNRTAAIGDVMRSTPLLGFFSYAVAACIVEHPFLDDALLSGDAVGNQPIWIPLFASIVGGFIAIAGGELREHWKRARDRQAHLETIASEVRMCGVIAYGFLRGGVKAPSYRMPLIGHERSLAPLLAEGGLTSQDAEILSRYYVNATAFNRCLEYCHEAAFKSQLEKDANNLILGLQYDRACLKASKLEPGRENRRTHYDAAIDVLRKYMDSETLERLEFDAEEATPTHID